MTEKMDGTLIDRMFEQLHPGRCADDEEVVRALWMNRREGFREAIKMLGEPLAYQVRQKNGLTRGAILERLDAINALPEASYDRELDEVIPLYALPTLKG